MMKHFLAGFQAIALGTILIVVPAVGQQAEPATGKTARLVRVTSVTLEDYADTATLTGEIAARTRADMAFRLSGQITRIDVSVGDHVVAGQVLARLDPETQEADLSLAEASVRAAQAALDQAQAAAERQRSLFETGLTTASRNDQARADAAAAQGNLDAALAMRDTARNALSYTELRAESDAIVTQVDREPGEIAQAAQPVVSLANDGPRDAVFNVYESLLFAPAKAIAAATVHVALVSDAKVTTTGHLREISPTVDTRTGTVRVTVGLEHTPAEMALGALVTGQVTMAPVPAFVIPWTAITLDHGQPAVWLVDPDKQTSFIRQVKIAKYTTSAVVIADGLEAGDMVVTAGGQFLYQGCPVRILTEAKP